MELETDDNYQYIIPLCPAHNKKNVYDRGGYWMLTKLNTWAVQIDPEP